MSADKLTLNGRSLCLDTVMDWMSAEESRCYTGPVGDCKWQHLRSVRAMISEGYCRETMIVLFEEAMSRDHAWGHAADDILEWLLSGDEE